MSSQPDVIIRYKTVYIILCVFNLLDISVQKINKYYINDRNYYFNFKILFFNTLGFHNCHSSWMSMVVNNVGLNGIK